MGKTVNIVVNISSVKIDPHIFVTPVLDTVDGMVLDPQKCTQVDVVSSNFY